MGLHVHTVHMNMRFYTKERIAQHHHQLLMMCGLHLKSFFGSLSAHECVVCVYVCECVYVCVFVCVCVCVCVNYVIICVCA